MKSFERETACVAETEKDWLAGSGGTTSARALLDAALAAQESAFLLVGLDGAISHVSDSAASILGLEIPLAEPVTVEDVGLAPLTEAARLSLEDPSRVFWADVHIRSTGRYAKLRAAAVAEPPDAASGVVVFLRDTGREHELDRMKADFLSAISHELRTPLTSILGYANLIIDAGDLLEHDDRLQFLGTIESQGRALLNLINDLTEIAKLDSSSFRLQLQPEQPRAIVSQMAEEFTSRALAADIALETRCAAAVPRVYCDAVRVRQALTYLLDNALKFTGSGGMVTISALVEDGQVAFAVADTGIGIGVDAGQRDRLFETFTRANPRADRSAGSTGLGLAIVKKIAEVHGGGVFVESEPGKGSRFGFRLPCAGSAESGAEPGSADYPIAA